MNVNAQRSDLIRHARQFQGPNGCVGQPCSSPNCSGVCDHPYSEFCAECDHESQMQDEQAEFERAMLNAAH